MNDHVAQPTAQPRHHLRLPHVAHLMRHARHGHDDVAVALAPPARSGAARVGQRSGRSRASGLLQVALRHGIAASRKMGPQVGLELGILDDIFAEHRGDGLAREVVLSRAKTACADHQVRTLEAPGQHLRESPQVVAHGGYPIEVDAQRGQLLRDPRGIRVRDLAHQDFCPNGHDLAAHNPRSRLARRPGRSGRRCAAVAR